MMQLILNECIMENKQTNKNFFLCDVCLGNLGGFCMEGLLIYNKDMLH